MSPRARRTRRQAGDPAPGVPLEAGEAQATDGQSPAAGLPPASGAGEFAAGSVFDLGNHRLVEQAEEMALRLECAKLADEELPLGVAYTRFLDLVHRAISFEHGTLYVTEWGSGRLTPVAVRGRRIELADQIRFARGSGLSAWVAQEGRAVVIPDPEHSDRSPFSDQALRAFLAFPLVQNGVVAGVVALARSERTFSGEEFARLGRLAEPLALTLSRLRREARLRELIYLDTETGLSNRHHFMARMEEELQRARQHAVEFSMALIEMEGIDGQIGKPAGKQLVRSFTGRLQLAMRSCDMAASLGGGRFGLLLAGVDRERAEPIVARIVKAVLADPQMTTEESHVRLRVAMVSSAEADDSVDTLLSQASSSLEYVS